MSVIIKRVDLARCPFCSSQKAEVFRPGMYLYSVQCRKCGTKGPDKKAKCDAVEAWAMMEVMG